MPKLKGMRFTTAIIERYRRRETSVEEAMIEMYLAGVSTRRIEDDLRDPVGVERVGGDRLEPEREGVRRGRGVAKPPARSRLPLRLRRRHLPEAQLGRELRERGGDGGDRRQRRRLPRGDRRRRGLHRVGRVLAGVPLVAEVARAARGQDVHRRQGRRHGRLDRRGLPERRLPALHGPFLPQRAGEGAQVQEAQGGRDAQGHTRHGVARGLRGQGPRGGRRVLRTQ